MLPKLLLTIRTTDRSPKTNYIRRTVDSLLAGGVKVGDMHIFPTEPEWSWMAANWIGISIHAPTRKRTPNQNGLAPIALLDRHEADWIILSEDDLEWCEQPLEMMANWLATTAEPDVIVHRFFAFDHLKPVGPHVAKAPLREMKGSQVIALRAADARRFAAWAAAHPLDWRPKGAPFQDQPENGFDKLVGYWALQDRPSVPYGLVSVPFFVKHIGVESSLHARGRTDTNRAFRARPLEVSP